MSSTAATATIIHDHAFLDCLTVPQIQSLSKVPFALIVLNGDTGSLLSTLWTAASVRICADGGANRVYDSLPHSLVASHRPAAVLGDFDSARSEVLDHFRSLDVPVIHIADQNSTDLMKSLNHLVTNLRTDIGSDGDSGSGSNGQWRHLVIYGGYGGRLDQQLGNIHTVHRFSHDHPYCQSVLLNEGNLCEILVAGQHIIQCHRSLERAGNHCGLLSLGERCERVSTSGLHWNLTDSAMEWGHNTSTCNILADTTVTVECSAALVWTTELSLS